MKLVRKPTQVLWHNDHRHGSQQNSSPPSLQLSDLPFASCKQARALVSMRYMEWGSQWSMYLTIPLPMIMLLGGDRLGDIFHQTLCCRMGDLQVGSMAIVYTTEFQLWPELNLPLLFSTCSLFCHRMVSKCAHKAEPWPVDLRKWDPTFVLEHPAKFLEPNGYTYSIHFIIKNLPQVVTNHEIMAIYGKLRPPTSKKKCPCFGVSFRVSPCFFGAQNSKTSFKPRWVERRTDDQRASAKLSVPRLLKELANTGPRRVL